MFSPQKKITQTKIIPPELSILSLLRACWKRKWLLLGAWIVIGAGTMVVVHKLPPVYTWEVRIRGASQKIPDLFFSSPVRADIQDPLATINQQLFSATRLLRIIDDFNLYEKERYTMVQEEILQQMRRD